MSHKTDAPAIVARIALKSLGNFHTFRLRVIHGSAGIGLKKVLGRLVEERLNLFDLSRRHTLCRDGLGLGHLVKAFLKDSLAFVRDHDAARALIGGHNELLDQAFLNS